MNTDEELYGLDDWEALEDSVEDVIDRVFVGAGVGIPETLEATADRIEWPIRVLVFRRMDAKRHANRIAAIALENALEQLDDEFAGDGDDTKPSESMEAAAKAFADAIVADYKPWACEPTGQIIEVSRAEALEMVKG